MKKVLLGTTALVAAAALAGPSFAAEKVKLGLGGYFAGSAAYVDAGDLPGDNRDYTFGSDSEVHIKGSTVLDNGLTVGFVAELELERDNEASTGNDDVDEVYIELKGGFGEIEFGQQDGVAEQMYIGAPNVFRRVLLTDSDLSATEKVTGGEIDVFLEESDDNTKVSYFTPRIGGFQLGVSFMPEFEKNTQDYNGLTELDDSTPETTDRSDEIFEAAINFQEEWNDVSFAFGASYLTGDDIGTGSDSPSFWALGGRIGFAGFTIGAGYSEKEGIAALRGSGDPSETDIDSTENYEVGVTYKTGPWVLGVGYSAEDLSVMSGGTTPEQELTKILGGVTYELGPSITLGVGIEVGELDSDAAGADREATAFFTELGIGF